MNLEREAILEKPKRVQGICLAFGLTSEVPYRFLLISNTIGPKGTVDNLYKDNLRTSKQTYGEQTKRLTETAALFKQNALV